MPTPDCAKLVSLFQSRLKSRFKPKVLALLSSLSRPNFLFLFLMGNQAEGRAWVTQMSGQALIKPKQSVKVHYELWAISSCREAYKYLQTPQDTSIQPFDQSLHWHQESPRFPMALISGEPGWIYLGSWGGKGGEYSTYKAEGPIMQITIRHGDVIDSILFESKSYNGNVIGSSVKIGGTGGSSSAKFCIDSSVEKLTSISLKYNDYFGHTVITSLYFETNIGNKYGPFGRGSDASFVSIPIEGGFIAGFRGSADRRGYLEAIGIFVAPKGNVGNEGGCISLGIEGGKEGAYWAYKADEPIMVISIRYGEAIDSIIFQSRTGDKLGRSMKIGDDGGGTTKTFSIDSSVEQISSISLTYEEFYGSGEVTIISLSFETNIGNKYGPFGSRTGTSSVSIPIEGGDFVGFHGRVGVYLTAIGVLVAPKHLK